MSLKIEAPAPADQIATIGADEASPASCSTCGRPFATANVPTIDAAIENFRNWQLLHGPIHRWPADAMERLRVKLSDLGKGVELLPCYAMSVGVRLRDGRIILIDRNGRETKG